MKNMVDLTQPSQHIKVDSAVEFVNRVEKSLRNQNVTTLKKAVEILRRTDPKKVTPQAQDKR